MNLQLIDGPMEFTIPHHSQIVCRKTGPDQWVVDQDKVTAWATDESIDGFGAKVFEGLIDGFGIEYVRKMLLAAEARVNRTQAVEL